MSGAEFDSIRNHYLGLGYVAAFDVATGQWHCIHFDAREQLGVFVELMQCSPEVYAGVENMRAAHVKLGQHRPRREFMELMPQ